MNYKIDEVEGIGPTFAAKLTEAGVKNTDDLLSKAGGAAGRKDLAARTGIGESQILKWCNHADLMRVNGVGKQFAELLEAAGVDTVKELGNRNAANLAAKMKEVNESKKLARTSPAESVVGAWIEAAKRLDYKISH